MRTRLPIAAPPRYAASRPWGKAMGIERNKPLDIAQRVAQRRARRPSSRPDADSWRRETYCLSRLDAREKAQEWFDRYPKAAYMTEIEFWRELADGRIEFTIRRLPTSD